MDGSVDLVIVGHLGFNEDHSPYGSHRSHGGAAYGAARGAGVLAPERVGIVAAVGSDYDFGPIRDLGVDVEGVRTRSGGSARFRLTEHADGTRSFETDLGVAAEPALDAFPDEYAGARHFHLCTAPPAQQVAWLEFLRGLPGVRTISGDAFEAYAEADPEMSRAVLSRCDLLFMNEEERRILYPRGIPGEHSYVVKNGAGGASYVDSNTAVDRPARQVVAVDTTHAGEILAGTFLRIRLAGFPPSVALAHAVRAATAKVTEFGVDGEALRSTLHDIARACAREAGDAV
jgi:sugar/nucleoside kinase (ribokinase family)